MQLTGLWFYHEATEATKLKEKRLKQFKLTKLHIYQDLCKEDKQHVLKLIKEQKKPISQRKVRETIDKSKIIVESSEILPLGLPSKKV